MSRTYERNDDMDRRLWAGMEPCWITIQLHVYRRKLYNSHLPICHASLFFETAISKSLDRG